MTAPLCFIDTETTGLDPDRHEIWEVACIIRTYVEGEDLEKVQESAGDLGVVAAFGESRYVWQLPVDLGRADTIALNIGHFHERRSNYFNEGAPSTGYVHDVLNDDDVGLVAWCHDFARLTWGAHMIGMVPSFDTDRLWRLLRAHGACPGWHYQPIDVETLAVGAILGTAAMLNPAEVVRYVDARPMIRTGDVDHAIDERPEDLPDRGASGRRLMMERTALPWDSERLSSWFGIDASRYDRHTALGDVEWARDLWDAIHEGATS